MMSIGQASSPAKNMTAPTAVRGKFAVDSPLEEAVSSEPVSEAKFPASWENTGNSSDSGLDDANLPAKRLKWSMTYKENSLRLGTGN